MSLQPSENNVPPPKRSRTGERTLLACIGCKHKKLKCDGQSPKCQNCVRTGREDPASGLQRPRDYLKLVESRVVYLESLLQQVRPEIPLHQPFAPVNRPDTEDDVSGVLATGSPPIQQTGHNFNPAAGTLHNGAESSRMCQSSNAPMDDQKADHLSSEVALLCLSATGREPHYFGPSSAVSFSRIVSATMGIAPGETASNPRQSADPNPDELRPGVRPDNTATSRCSPSPSTSAKLTQAYFDNIHPQYPFLHRPTFEGWEEEFRRGTQSGDINTVADIPLFFVLMVYAIGSLALGQDQHKAAEMYYSMALDHISPVLSSDGLESIQCILSCAVYSIRSPVGVSLWKISGMAIRHSIDLGYHRSTEYHHRSADTLTKEMIKRCFWVAYDVDRVAAFTLGRPVGIPEAAIDVELPTDIDDIYITPAGLLQNPRSSNAEPPTIMTSMLHVTRLRRLWAKFSENLYMKSPYEEGVRKTTVQHLRRELDDWQASLPAQLNISRSHPLSVFASSEWFQLAYDHSILLLYRPYITSTVSQTGPFSDRHGVTSSDEQETIDRAFEECSVRAREICLLYRRLYQSSSIQFTWGSLHILFLGGLTYLYCLWRSKRVREMTRQTDVVSTCMACSTVLVIIAERWNLATSYRDLFQTLSERTTSMVLGNGNLEPSQRPSTEPQLGFGLPESPEGHLQDWIMNLHEMSIPQESEWLVQDLLQGDPQFRSNTFYSDEFNYPPGPSMIPGATEQCSGERYGDPT